MTASLIELPIDRIHPAADNIRRDVGDVTELAASIESLGILEPLVVTPNGDGFVIVAGARRHAAAKQAGVTVLPCLVRDFDERGRIEAMLVENLQRADIKPLEEAEAYQRLTRLGLDQRTIAERVGRSQPHVSKRLTILDLPADVAERVGRPVDAGGITIDSALQLARLKDHPSEIKKILDRTSLGRVQTYQVDQALQAVKRREKVNSLKAELKKKGWTVVKPVNGYYADPAYRILDDSPRTRHAIAIKPKDHRKEPCHGAYVSSDQWSNKVAIVEVCTEPARHVAETGESPVKADVVLPKAQPATSTTRDTRSWEERDRDARVEARAQAAPRRAVLKAIFEAKLNRTAVSDFACAVLAGIGAERVYVGNFGEAIAAEALGLITEPEEALSHGAYDEAAAKALDTYRRQGALQRLRVGVAVALGYVEEAITQENVVDGPTLDAYFTLLGQHGYVLTKGDKQMLQRANPQPAKSLGQARKEARAAKAEQRACRKCGATAPAITEISDDDEPRDGWPAADLCGDCAAGLEAGEEIA